MTTPDITLQLIEILKASHGLLLSLAANVLGWWLVFDAVQKISRSTRRSGDQISMSGQTVRILIGALLTQISSFIEGLVQGLTGQGVDITGPMSIMPAQQSKVFTDILHFGFLVLFVVGVASIIWGARLWARAADGAGQGARTDTSPALVGTVHIIFGALGINAWRWSDYLI